MVEGLLAGHIIHQYDPIRPSIVGAGDGPKPLLQWDEWVNLDFNVFISKKNLSSCVPLQMQRSSTQLTIKLKSHNLKFHSLLVQLHRPEPLKDNQRSSKTNPKQKKRDILQSQPQR